MKDFQEIATELVIKLWHCNEESFQQAGFQWYRDTIQEALSEAFAKGRVQGIEEAISSVESDVAHTGLNPAVVQIQASRIIRSIYALIDTKISEGPADEKLFGSGRELFDGDVKSVDIKDLVKTSEGDGE